MQMRQLGRTGLEVSCIGLGGMPLSISDDRPFEADAIKVIHRAIDLGVNFIDTADAYCLDDLDAGHNERLIGKALSELPAAKRQNIYVATKGGLVRPGRRWEPDGSEKHLREACEASLKNLRTDRITLYQLHRIDPKAPLAESIGCLKKLQEEGKIRHIGVSNFSVLELQHAETIAPIVSVQNQYSRKHRQPETDGVLEYSRQRGMAFLPWSPLNGIKGSKSLGAHEPLLESLAVAHNCSPQRVVLAWLLSKGPHVIPIPGASRIQSVEDSARAGDLKLRREEIEALNV
ncbi:MAG TPA: aldo/keto reductase [Phycisphaerae bacterium]|nr:aldo/keto reductase [Phycisphaerae bacterium]